MFLAANEGYILMYKKAILFFVALQSYGNDILALALVRNLLETTKRS
jgi:hypothetical protein